MELNLGAGVYTSSSSESGTTSNDSDGSDAAQSAVMALRRYQFEPVISKNNDAESESDSEGDDEGNEDETDKSLLNDLNW